MERPGPGGKPSDRGAERIVIVGAGVIGCAVALELARAGRPATIIDAGGVAAGVSGASLAAIALHPVSDVDELEIVVEAGARWWDLSRELFDKTGIDIEYERSGHLCLLEADNAEDAERLLAERATVVERERKSGLRVELVTVADARARLPGLEAKRLVGASWCADDAKLNALKTCRALATAANRLGASLRVGDRVRRIEPGTPCRVHLSDGAEDADVVVLAAGAATPALVAPLSARLARHMTPVKASCCASEALPKWIDPIVSSVSVGLGPGYTQLHQTKHGEILFNTVDSTSREDDVRPLGASVDLTFMRNSAQKLIELFPFLAPFRLLRAWSAYETWTTDHRFFVGPVPEAPEVLVAAGDSGVGFIRAPIVSRAIAAHLAGTPWPDAARYLPARVLVSGH